MEKTQVFEGSGQLSYFSFLLCVPFPPSQGFSFHLRDQIGKQLHILKSLHGSPSWLRDKLERLSLVGRIQRDFFLDQSHHFIFFNLLLSDQDPQTQNSSDEQFVLFEETSSCVVEALVSDALCESFYSLLQHLRINDFVFWLFLFFFFLSLAFFSFSTFSFDLFRLLRVHLCSHNVNGSVHHNNEGIQRELVERVDFVEFIQHEEY
mmetsp:Transcript_7681/g.7098  ORF Transcript_7681/g.7098 Transcript_7681/m.7098 type:complete len:206 (-) Transcript_7681:2671-3288(-)